MLKLYYKPYIVLGALPQLSLLLETTANEHLYPYLTDEEN